MAGRAVVLTRRLTKISTIEIDACLDESHDLSNTVTDHPVEEGFNITDHSRPNPDKVTLSCFVSNTPLSVQQQNNSLASGAVDFAAFRDAVHTIDVTAADGRGDNAYRALKKIRDTGELIQVVTTLRTYGLSATEGMMIESITIPRTTRTYDGLAFSITLKQVRIVRNKQTRDTRPKDKRVEVKKKKGATVTKDEPSPDSKLVQLGAPGAVGR